ncbi:uncharacterized protein N0V89_012509 [Didymosphaeria variabile]|uniref:Uncharacterized protein n=1 Tax=Didymosphaeria variabile TaxID=1932322 RepID=A0A9W8XA22_9PLEO|nr:uncharacterized protein N0V89_012509 [Didymosphaeria variabile]KAJ4344765.1 hypothetical protein N0V89_012509 [Didymosphaeria variabile]
MSAPNTPKKNASTGSPKSTYKPFPSTDGFQQSQQTSPRAHAPAKSANSPANKSDKSTSAGSGAGSPPRLGVDVPAYFTPIEGSVGLAFSDRRASSSTYTHSPTPTDASAPPSLGTHRYAALYTAALPAKDPNQREPGILPTEDIVTKLRNPDRALYIENDTKVKIGWEGIMYTCGAENFLTAAEDENGTKRRLLSPETQLYQFGLSMGVPKPVYDWLCSDPAAGVMVFDASIFEPID